MLNLLSANFLRLRKNRLFWGILAVCAIFAGFRVYTQLSDQIHYNIQPTLDNILFTYAQLIGLTAAVFTSLFLGTEYSDGAIRNKVMSGRSRVTIYLAGFLTVFAASVLSLAAYWAVALGFGIPLFGGLRMSAGEALSTLLGILLMTAAFCALFTFVTMNCSRKAATAVACILLFFAMLVASTYVFGRLDAPEFISSYDFTVNGELQPTEPEPNPRYLRGTERTAYEFFRDLLPTGQSILYSIGMADNPARLMVLAVAVFAVFTGAGAALFRRKDLK